MKQKEYPFTQNRELSWLKFDQRVLEEAATASVELLERLNFLAIFSSNLDEFFMVRVGSLSDIMLIDDTQVDKKSGMYPSETLNSIFSQVKRLYPMRDNVFKSIFSTLKELQIQMLSYKQLNKKQLKQVNKIFTNKLMPLLAPQIISFHHPFPFLINKELYIFFRIEESGKSKYGIVPMPDYLDRIIYLNDEKTEFILSEEVIFHKLQDIFPKGKITFKTIIRVTRNADINLDPQDIDEDEDYRQYMKKILKRRNRLAPVRLEIFKYADNAAIDYLCKQLNLSKKQVFISKQAPLEMEWIRTLVDQLPREKKIPLEYKPFQPQVSSYLNPNEPLIPQIEKRDVLLSYPYENIDLFIALLKEAAESPEVLSIRITIYRLAKYSRIVHYLCRAAENGKEVTVLMELRARFDERNNIEAAERLEQAGCNIIYGLEDYKVHSKIMEITYRNKRGQTKTITQIGTGNYNEKTSKLYTDLSFITSREDIGRDATEFFKNMNISNISGEYNRLIASPKGLKYHVMDLLDEQIARASQGLPASASFKLNGITDLEMIQKLAEASQAGVKIKMIVRGICCMLPGLPGYTDNIEIHQIVGRFLEHARIYIFGEGEEEKVYIASADFMTRNTERRVEIGVPIDDPELKSKIRQYFETQFQDNIKGRKLLPTGVYAPIPFEQNEPLDSQIEFMEEAKKNEIPRSKPQSFFSRFFKRS